MEIRASLEEKFKCVCCESLNVKTVCTVVASNDGNIQIYSH